MRCRFLFKLLTVLHHLSRGQLMLFGLDSLVTGRFDRSEVGAGTGKWLDVGSIGTLFAPVEFTW